MKKLKKIVVMAMVGMMCFGGYSIYEYVDTTNATYLMMKNVEALTQSEGTPTGTCARRSGPNGKYGNKMFCDSRTDATMIYPCPSSSSNDFYMDNNMDRCTP